MPPALEVWSLNHWTANEVPMISLLDLGLDPGVCIFLENGMAAHSSILAWRIPWTEEPGGLQSIGHRELDTTEVTEHTLTTVFL